MRAFRKKSDAKPPPAPASKPAKSLAKSIGLLSSTSRPRLSLTPANSPSPPASMPSTPHETSPSNSFPTMPLPAPRVPQPGKSVVSVRAELVQLRSQLLCEGGPLSAGVLARLLRVPESDVQVIESVEDRFSLQQRLGSGQCATVFSAKRVGGGDVAVKLIEQEALLKNVETVGMARAEVEAMRAIPPHPNLISLLEICCTGRELMLSLELLPRGDLLGYILDHESGIAEVECREIFDQLARSLAHMHSHGWAHRDLKPENVCLALLDNGDLIVSPIELIPTFSPFSIAEHL